MAPIGSSAAELLRQAQTPRVRILRVTRSGSTRKPTSCCEPSNICHKERIGQELATYQVTSVEFNVSLSDALFVYAPPPDATIGDSESALKGALAKALAN